MTRSSRALELLAVIAWIAVPWASAEALSVTRGPYLQNASSSAITIRWRTDEASLGRVEWGLSPDTLTQSMAEEVAGTEHEVRVTGLPAATRIFYSIGTPDEVLAGADAGHGFVTAPPPGAVSATRIWVIGDAGTASTDAAAVRDAFLAASGDRAPDLWLMLGDNAYDVGSDAQYQTAVFDMYPTLLRSVPLWPTLGNHDGYSADSATETGPYYDAFALPRAGEAGGVASGTEAYYSFDHGRIHFVCLDSYDSDLGAEGAMVSWLEADLSATSADWVIAFWHHPPYTKGSHDSDVEQRLIDVRGALLPVLEEHGVDLVLSGHSHGYERSALIDGHYGSSATLELSMVLDGGDGGVDGSGAYRKPAGGPAAHAGALYVVAGSSGKVGGGPLDHPAMKVAIAELGSVVIDVEGLRLDLRFLDAAGAARDHVTMLKGDHLLGDGFEGGSLSRWNEGPRP